MTAIESLGIAAAVFFTVGALTLPVRDNLYWKVCEHLYLGFAGGYMLIVAYKAIQANLFSQLSEGNLIYIIPLILSILLYARFVPAYGWIGRYPVALLVGVGTAVSLRTLIDAMFISQIAASFINPIAPTSEQVGSVLTPFNNIIIILGTVTVAFYFIFWRNQLTTNKGANWVRTVGIWFMMLQFGVNLGNGWIMRASRLGARFFYILDPQNWIYTAVFALVGIASLYFTGEKSGESLTEPEIEEE
jgi:hypothetical protein